MKITQITLLGDRQTITNDSGSDFDQVKASLEKSEGTQFQDNALPSMTREQRPKLACVYVIS